MRACGWDVIDIEDGLLDVGGIVSALKRAKSSPEGQHLSMSGQ